MEQDLRTKFIHLFDLHGPYYGFINELVILTLPSYVTAVITDPQILIKLVRVKNDQEYNMKQTPYNYAVQLKILVSQRNRCHHNLHDTINLELISKILKAVTELIAMFEDKEILMYLGQMKTILLELQLLLTSSHVTEYNEKESPELLAQITDTANYVNNVKYQEQGHTVEYGTADGFRKLYGHAIKGHWFKFCDGKHRGEVYKFHGWSGTVFRFGLQDVNFTAHVIRNIKVFW